MPEKPGPLSSVEVARLRHIADQVEWLHENGWELDEDIVRRIRQAIELLAGEWTARTTVHPFRYYERWM